MPHGGALLGLLAKTEETFIHNWQETEWAEWMMEAVSVVFNAEDRTTH